MWVFVDILTINKGFIENQQKQPLGGSDRVRYKSACAATEASKSLEILDLETRENLLFSELEIFMCSLACAVAKMIYAFALSILKNVFS